MPILQRKPFQDTRSPARQYYAHLPAVSRVALTSDQPRTHGPVDQPDCGVMCELQVFRDVSNGSPDLSATAPDREQQRVLLRGQTRRAGTGLDKMKKAPQRRPEIGQRFVIRFLQCYPRFAQSSLRHLEIVS